MKEKLLEILRRRDLGEAVHILDLTLHQDSNSPLLKIVADTEAGITIGEISSLSRRLRCDDELTAALGTEDYRVTVSSPGVKWEMTESWQFGRHTGRNLCIELLESQPGLEPAKIEARLMEVTQSGIVLNQDGNPQTLAWEEIKQATVVLDW